MIFESKYPLPETPKTDVFNYIFHHGRRPYPWSRVLYRVDQTGETLTLAQMEEKSRRFADAIRFEYGIMPKDVVGILAQDKIQYPIAYFGALAAGATVAPIPVQQKLTDTDVAARLTQSEVKLLIMDSASLDLAAASAHLVHTPYLITLDHAAHRPYATPDEPLARGQPDANIFHLTSESSVAAHDAFLNRTGGSTGTVKSVLTSHAHFIATMEGTLGTIPANTDPTHDVWVSPLSLGFFINAKLHMGLNILLGIPVVLLRDGHILDETTVDVVARHRFTFLFITPPAAARLARADLSAIDVRSVKWLLTTGAPMHQTLRRAVSRQFGGVPLDLEWGTSETMLIAVQTGVKQSRRDGSSGTLVNGMQAKVICTGAGRAELGAGRVGEILVRNRLCRYRGYKGNEAANVDFDADGWFHTGDYGYLDEEYNVFIVDRIKELLKVGGGYGTHISAAELEAVVFEHPAVASVVVVGMRNDFTQLDEPTAFVIPRSGYNAGDGQLERDILHFADQRLTGLQHLIGGVRCLAQFPTTGFKINRKALRQLGNRSLLSGPDTVAGYVQTV